jgi:chromate transporter
VVQAGLTPVTAGLVMSAAILLCLATATSLPAAALSLATALVLLTRRVHPLWMLALGAVLGVAGVL